MMMINETATEREREGERERESSVTVLVGALVAAPGSFVDALE